MVYLQWVVDAWESITPEDIVKSFKDCGISVATDGSEDDSIHCLKPDGMCPGGRQKLTLARMDIEMEEALVELVEEIDLEQDIANDNLEDAEVALENFVEEPDEVLGGASSQFDGTVEDECTYRPGCSCVLCSL